MVNYLKQQRSNDDEVQRFMLSMVPAIRKLPDEAKEELMFNIHSLVHQAQISARFSATKDHIPSHVTTRHVTSQQPYSLPSVTTANSSPLDLNYMYLQPLVTTRPSTCTTSQMLSSATIPEEQQHTYNGPL